MMKFMNIQLKVRLFQDFVNNSHLYRNCGWTPSEFYLSFSETCILSLFLYILNIAPAMAEMITKKIG